jgi:hypothetical protein
MLNDTVLFAEDGAVVGEETRLSVTATDQAEMLLFDLP